MINDLANSFQKLIAHPELLNIFFETGLITFFTALFSYIFKIILNRLRSKSEVNTSWNSILVISLAQPIQLLIWGVGIAYCLELMNFAFKLESLRAMSTIRTMVTIFSICWYLLSIVNKLESRWISAFHEHSTKLDTTTIGAIIKLLKMTLFIVAGLITLETLGFSISGVLAFGSISGAGVSFAAKDLLANFFGALMIYLDKPFKEGDYIKVDSKGVEGVVEKIGLRCTMIRNLDKVPLYVPNSIFANTAIENPSRMTHKRINEIVTIRHEDFKVAEKIIMDTYDYLKKNAKIDQRLDTLVYITEVSYLGVCIQITAFTKSTDAKLSSKIKNDLMLEMARIIESNGAKFAYKDSIVGKAIISQ